MTSNPYNTWNSVWDLDWGTQLDNKRAWKIFANFDGKVDTIWCFEMVNKIR